MPFCTSHRCLPHACLPRTRFTITSCKWLLTEPMEASVVQLQLLDLMIRNGHRGRARGRKGARELIDLMARILVAVFEAQGGRADESGLVQSQDQAGASGAQSASSTYGSPATSRCGRTRRVSAFSMTWPSECGTWVGKRWRSSIAISDAAPASLPPAEKVSNVY